MESSWTNTSHKITFEVSLADMAAAWDAIESGIEVAEEWAVEDGGRMAVEVRNEIAALAGAAFFALRKLRALMRDFDAANLAVQSIGFHTLKNHMLENPI